MIEPEIPMYAPLIEGEEIAGAVEALEMKWLGMGSYVQRFEEELRRYLGTSQYIAALSTGHAALHLGLLLAGVGKGDEVISASFNNVADFQAILATGASPVLCDIEDATLCLDLAKAEELVSNKTKAIIAMDYGCLTCDHDEVAKFAQRHHLRVLHDAAHSFGSSYKGRKIGTFSDLCMFSFDPVKNITCIDGGVLIVNTEDELARLHEMRLIGMGQPAKVMYQNKRAWTYDVKSLGFRYHMPNLHAAIGLAQLKKMHHISDTKRRAARAFHAAFGALGDLRIPQTDFAEGCPFLYYVRCPAGVRDDFRAFLGARGVHTGIHWQPGHSFSLFADCRRGDLAVTTKVAREIVSLPLHSSMPDDAIERVCSAVVDFFRGRNGA